MTERANRLVDLSGYATLAFVLATANWASPLSLLFVAPLLFGTLAYAGWHLYVIVLAHARGQLDSEPVGADPAEVDQPVGSDS
ncbi:hypothetical protein [Halolamina sp.]|uniref:hypothetical protein n=1 Tax=Halolamina sp. TaxID=1940283 RepID=UPI0035650857